MSDIKVRVGQQNAVKVVSSVSGSSGGRAVVAENVIGGIGSIRELSVSGISTFVGVSTFKNDVYIDGDLIVGDDLRFDEFTARNGNITGIASIRNLNVTGLSTFVGLSTFKNGVYIAGIATISGNIYYTAPHPTYGVLFFGEGGLVSATNSPGVGNTDTTNYVLTTNNNVPIWSNTIDGGSY
jgi:hypothetical protein